MIDLKKKYWLITDSYTYVVIKNGEMLLYNTENGEFLETSYDVCLQLFNKLQERNNLGVVALDEKYIQDSACISFIEKAIDKKIVTTTEIKIEFPKPIVLLPILNLQRDVDRMKKENKFHVGDELLTYITEINIYINEECKLNCKHCDLYYKQTEFCTRGVENHILKPEVIKGLLMQLRYSSVRKINILGGDILSYPYWEELSNVLKIYDYDFHYWTYYKNFSKTENWLKANDLLYKEILIDSPIDKEIIQQCLSQYSKDKNVRFNFLIENKAQYAVIKQLSSLFYSKHFHLIPVFTRNNIDFFKKYIYLNKEDILSKTIIQRKIFCNQTVNTNNFGKLYILPNGEVRANRTSISIGNIFEDILLKIIYNELVKNTAWRKIRDGRPCDNCLYQFLCPPPSNYESLIGIKNLCNVK